MTQNKGSKPRFGASGQPAPRVKCPHNPAGGGAYGQPRSGRNAGGGKPAYGASGQPGASSSSGERAGKSSGYRRG